jgi:hypothetical protein
LDSTVAFGAEPSKVIIPLLVVPVSKRRPEVPDEPDEPEVPELPLSPELPEEPLVPEEPELPVEPNCEYIICCAVIITEGTAGLIGFD